MFIESTLTVLALLHPDQNPSNDHLILLGPNLSDADYYIIRISDYLPVFEDIINAYLFQTKNHS